MFSVNILKIQNIIKLKNTKKKAKAIFFKPLKKKLINPTTKIYHKLVFGETKITKVVDQSLVKKSQRSY